MVQLTGDGDPEVIVVGGGHNGLICATYLARSGIETLLLEARPAVGGCASTVSDLGARFNICHCDHTMIRAMPIIDELDLHSHGLHYLESEVAWVNMFHDESEPWLFFHDAERTLESIARTYPTQLDGYRRYLADAIPVAKFALEMAGQRASVSAVLRSAVRRRAKGVVKLLEWSRRSASSVLADYFDDWHLVMPAICTGPTVWGVPGDMPGTGLAAVGYATRHLVQSGRPRGGSGSLTDALRSSFEQAGGMVRCRSEVSSLAVADGVVRGVVLANGDELRASRVVAACDPHRVFVDWIDDAPPAARKVARRWRDRPVAEGYESKVDAVLTSLPTFRAAERIHANFPGTELLGPSGLVAPSPEQMADAHRLRAEGQVAPHPMMLLNVPSVIDPAMRPDPSRHVLSIEVLFTPYSLSGGWPESGEPKRWLELWADLMEPGALDGVEKWRAMTPDRYEQEFGMHRGHTPSYSSSPLSTLVGRQRELSRYRTPIEGLYLSGAGTYPGAGIFGASGRNAADVVRRDVQGRRRLPRTLTRAS